MGTLEHASLVRPCPGQSVGGDATVICPLEQGLFVAIVDVLGHGPEAHALALVIEDYLARHVRANVEALMKRLHEQLRGTRGAVAGLCAIDASSGRADYVGAGNTVLRRFGATETRLVSQAGVLGQNLRTLRAQTISLEPGDLILLYTDGVSDRFAAEDYPGMFRHAPKEVVQSVIKRFGKDHDDAACIAVRYGE
jgi:serine phosphatase RsbU (regulator of sigma subunit)